MKPININPLDFPGKQFRIELLNPNPSSRMTKDGPVYKCSFEVTKETHEHFMTTNTSGLIIAAVCQVVESNPPKKILLEIGEDTQQERPEEHKLIVKKLLEIGVDAVDIEKTLQDELAQNDISTILANLTKKVRPVSRSINMGRARPCGESKKKREVSDKQREVAKKNYSAQPKLTRQAIGFCNSETFQKYVIKLNPFGANSLPFANTKHGIKLAEKYIHSFCGIKSRTELTEDNPDACERFNRLEAGFKGWLKRE